jgi:toxin ParE1/3/4
LSPAERFSVELTDEAARDLEHIHAYITEHASEREADALLDAFASKIESLETFPGRGSVSQEFFDLGVASFRQIVMPPYRIVYQIIHRRVVISMIVDGRRDVYALIEDFLYRNPPEAE